MESITLPPNYSQAINCTDRSCGDAPRNSGNGLNDDVSCNSSCCLSNRDCFSELDRSVDTQLSTLQDDYNEAYANKRVAPQYTPSMEPLPNYQPSIQSFGLALLKNELINPYSYNTNSDWDPIMVELNSTQLILYKLNLSTKLKDLLVALFKSINQVDTNKESILQQGNDEKDIYDENYDYNELDAYMTTHSAIRLKFSKFKHNKALKHLSKYYDILKDNKMLLEPIDDRQKFVDVLKQYQGQVLQKFTLYNVKIGEAPAKSDSSNIMSTVNYSNVLRLRIELKQSLLQFWSFDSMVSWLRNITIGKDLSVCFEDRNISKMRSLPNFNHFNNQLINKFYDSNVVERDNQYYIIDGFKLFFNNNFNELEIKFIQACLPKLNSFDKWNYLALSNVENDDSNIFIPQSKIKRVEKCTGNRCRQFSIEQEGLVAVKV